jgi:hypothetical protein
LGSVTFGPPGELAELLQQQLGLTCFFETGSFMGNTAAWAAERFAQVVTVDRSLEYFGLAKARFAHLPHVHALFGDSRHHLRQLAHSLPPTMFWLDAHWSGGLTAGEDDECPLLGEIAVVAPDLDRHCVLIDDARLFLAPPEPPHKPDHWPTLCETTDALRTHHQPYIVIHQDVIIAVPARVRGSLIAFLRGEFAAVPA